MKTINKEMKQKVKQKEAKQDLTFTANKKIVSYFREAGPDYAYWSKKMNMHFGLWKFPMNIFNREAMLDQMNEEVRKCLDLKENTNYNIADLGCGLGTVARHIAGKHTKVQITGVTLVPWQVRKARQINRKQSLENRIHIWLENYHSLPFQENSIDRAYAVESMCYSNGFSKSQFLQEAARVLKPGGRLVIADGFLQQNFKDTSKLFQRVYRSSATNWAVNEFAEWNAFSKAAKDNHFKIAEVKNVSKNIALSALHVPYVSLKFFFSEWIKNKKIGKQSINNVKACINGMLMGMFIKNFAYKIIVLQKEFV